MISEEVGDKLKDAAITKVNHGDKEGNKILIDAYHMLELKDVEELDDLTSHEFTKSTDV